jgi:hypothetical protein
MTSGFRDSKVAQLPITQSFPNHFGENTYGSGRYAKKVTAGERFQASFRMEWPWLASGDYSLTISIASGNQLSHVNHCWLNECMIINATPETKLANGVFSPCFLEIDLFKMGIDHFGGVC